jgi:ABC-type transporter Mla subunit MlaD
MPLFRWPGLSIYERLEHLEHSVHLLGEQMATLQADVDRLNADNAKLQEFVGQVKDFVANNSGTVDTSALESALTNLESTISSGSGALSPNTPPVVVNPPTS